MRHMLYAMGKRDAGSDAPAGDFFLLDNMNYHYHQSEMAGGIFIPIFKKGKVIDMKFAEALKNMKAGIPMKLPSWGGFWYWDDQQKTIMMKCRKLDSETGRDLLDIRETQRVEYTLTNILSDEWIPATEENTAVLGGTPTFGFGEAIKYLKRGLKVKRQGWNGKDQYIELANNISYENTGGEIVNADHDAIGNSAIAFVGTSGVQMGWLASQADMLAEDWVFADWE